MRTDRGFFLAVSLAASFLHATVSTLHFDPCFKRPEDRWCCLLLMIWGKAKLDRLTLIQDNTELYFWRH